MAEDLMRYDLLAQDALRGVVRLALLRVERTGLPGEHHFYISFHTQLPGVKISEQLKRKYEKEMTIVLQHQYWNLHTLEDRFEVELSFNDVPEKLVVPYAAIKGFFDPAAQFALQFETVELKPEESTENAEDQAQGTAAAHAQAPRLEISHAALPAPSNSDKKIVSLDSFRKK